MKSMTSYAYLDGIVNGTDISCELKSYNSRFLDLNINIPSTMTQLEPFLRKYFSKRIINPSPISLMRSEWKIKSRST